ncbi:MAG TPA: NAD(P)-binding domain-containing protein [Candidatus Sulfotelmatobacter sp.]|nr:NAD(P)-binding domain-containing protein [Candidatus Sulfotelmatobacter sp.]
MAEAPLTRKQTLRNATVFIGGGRITSALIGGLRLAKYGSPILVDDHNPAKLKVLRREFNVGVTLDLKSAVEQAEILIIAVRPDSVRRLLADIQRSGASSWPSVIISLAAGIPLRNLKRMAPHLHWARAMPSPACRTRHGLTALTFDASLPLTIRKQVRTLFGQVGSVLEIPEDRLDPFTVTYSASHGYHALATLTRAAMKAGLDEQTALLAASHALADAIVSWREGSSSLQELLHEAATPGGIAAATIQAMNKAGYERAVRRGLRAGLAKASSNAKA